MQKFSSFLSYFFTSVCCLFFFFTEWKSFKDLCKKHLTQLNRQNWKKTQTKTAAKRVETDLNSNNWALAMSCRVKMPTFVRSASSLYSWHSLFSSWDPSALSACLVYSFYSLSSALPSNAFHSFCFLMACFVMYASSVVRPLKKVPPEWEFATHSVSSQENKRLVDRKSWLEGPVSRSNMNHWVRAPQKAITWVLLHWCRLCPCRHLKHVSQICALRFCLWTGSSRIRILCKASNGRGF